MEEWPPVEGGRLRSRAAQHAALLEADPMRFHRKKDKDGPRESLETLQAMKDLLASIHPVRDPGNLSPPRTGYSFARQKSCSSAKMARRPHTVGDGCARPLPFDDDFSAPPNGGGGGATSSSKALGDRFNPTWGGAKMRAGTSPVVKQQQGGLLGPDLREESLWHESARETGETRPSTPPPASRNRSGSPQQRAHGVRGLGCDFGHTTASAVTLGRSVSEASLHRRRAYTAALRNNRLGQQEMALAVVARRRHLKAQAELQSEVALELARHEERIAAALQQKRQYL